jgi:polysaccharide deacetylase family protein (PEP-CTERM system associated)
MVACKLLRAATCEHFSARIQLTQTEFCQEPNVLNAITVDVEDYFHTEAMSAVVPANTWEQMPSRVVPMTERLLDLFARHDCKGTFFFLGWVAERHPQLVQKVVSSGHEIGCHSYWHRAVFRLSPDEFREDTRRAKDVIEQAAGIAIFGYRSPSFSMIPGTEWASQILVDLGFRYDSSVNPIRHDFYSNADAPRTPYLMADNQLVQLPIATVRKCATNLPCGGGAYLRVLPAAYFHWALRQLEAAEMPAMVYIHPWELDDEQPRLPAPLKSRLRQYLGLRRCEKKLGELLARFSFGTVQQAFATALSANPGIAAALIQ